MNSATPLTPTTSSVGPKYRSLQAAVPVLVGCGRAPAQEMFIWQGMLDNCPDLAACTVAVGDRAPVWCRNW